MLRDTAALSRHPFEVVIVGGGVVGAWIACDAARRGMSVALLERGDFGAATSAGSSKLAHGGLRYLARGEIAAAREALAERAVLMDVAAAHVRPIPFAIPVGGRWAPERLALAGLLRLYDRLGGHSAGFEPARFVSLADAAATDPVLAAAAPHGAMCYDDGLIRWPERLVLTILQEAAEHGAQIANHVDVRSIEPAVDGVRRVLATDRLDGETIEARGRVVVNATGPWADRLPGAAARAMVRSKGIHVVLEAPALRSAIAARGRGEHVFVVPWCGRALVGTTDDRFDADPDTLAVTRADVDGLLGKLARLMPSVSPGRVCHAYAALRPLPESTAATYRASRRAEVVDHAAGGEPGLITAVGGKWTTARGVAERVVDLIAARRGGVSAPCSTAQRTLPAPPPDADASTLEARTDQAMEQEMGVRLVDVVQRRLRPDAFALAPEAIDRVARRMADHLGWSEQRTAAERQALQAGRGIA